MTGTSQTLCQNPAKHNLAHGAAQFFNVTLSHIAVSSLHIALSALYIALSALHREDMGLSLAAGWLSTLQGSSSHLLLGTGL